MCLTIKGQHISGTRSSSRHRCKNSVLSGPRAACDSGLNSLSWNSRLFCPFSNALRHAIYRQCVIGALVSGLFFARRPVAVLRRVISIVVSALNLVIFGRRVTHVRKEVLKRLQPSVAYFDRYFRVGSAAVIGIGWIVLVGTSLNHSAPDMVRLGFSRAVSGQPLSVLFSQQTTAASSVPGVKINATVPTLVAITFALAPPECLASDNAWGGRCDRQITKYLTQLERESFHGSIERV